MSTDVLLPERQQPGFPSPLLLGLSLRLRDLLHTLLECSRNVCLAIVRLNHIPHILDALERNHLCQGRGQKGGGRCIKSSTTVPARWQTLTAPNHTLPSSPLPHTCSIGIRSRSVVSDASSLQGLSLRVFSGWKR